MRFCILHYARASLASTVQINVHYQLTPSPRSLLLTQAEGPLRSCAALRKLSLARCRAGPASGAHLASAAASSGFAVENLDLGGNSLADGGATALAEALRDASSGPALSLDLTSNEIRGADAAAALGRARRLRGLELFNNAIGDAGAAALAEALGTECALAAQSLHSSLARACFGPGCSLS